MKKNKVLSKNKEEIIYHLINSGLAGSLVLLGSFTAGGFSLAGFLTAAVASLIVAVTKFRDYWTTQETEYKKSIFNFL